MISALILVNKILITHKNKMAEYKTPGVYVEEISTLPPSVGQVPTAIPAFIGYTERAIFNGKSILNTPKHITSMLDFVQIFGGAASLGEISVTLGKDNNVDSVGFENNYYLFNSIRMFFANGGGECYIASVGLYGSEVDADSLLKGLSAVEKEDQPTILVCPDAMLLEKADQAFSLQQAMLAQCNMLQDRVAILDVFKGHVKREDEDVVLDFRSGIGVNHLKYGAAYYPWIETTLSSNFGFEDIKLVNSAGEDVDISDIVADPSVINNVQSAINDLKSISEFVSNPLELEVSLSESFHKVDADSEGTIDELSHYVKIIKEIAEKVIGFKDSGLKNSLIENEIKIKINSSSALANICRNLGSISTSLKLDVVDVEGDFPAFGLTEGSLFEGLEEADKIKKGATALKNLFGEIIEVLSLIKSDSASIKNNLDKAVYDTNPMYKSIVNDVKKNAALLPPSGSVAGVYAQVDNDRGVWKAPANVSLASTASPWLKIDNKQQEDLNVDVNAGKSINAIRPFTGKGTLVWGARTLAGNDNEWRYISVRRFFNMVEESIQLSTNWAVFEPNDVNTWVRVKAMIENYLTNLWKVGALAGATPDAAFFVNIGLGSTMSAVDILEGRMNIEIGMAAVRPAEFIVLKFSHKLQES